MGMARLRAGQLHAVMPARGPFVHHGVRDVGMELQRVSAPGPDRLHFERVAFRQKLGAGRHVETFAMPLIDAFRPGLDDSEPGRGGTDRVIADLGMAARMLEYFAAELPGAHLGAEADAEKGLVLLHRYRDPIDLGADEFVFVIGAHRAAENDGAGMVGHGLRQRLAEARAAYVEPVSQPLQGASDAAGCRVLLVKDDQNLLLHEFRRTRLSSYLACSRMKSMFSRRSRIAKVSGLCRRRCADRRRARAAHGGQSA